MEMSKRMRELFHQAAEETQWADWEQWAEVSLEEFAMRFLKLVEDSKVEASTSLVPVKEEEVVLELDKPEERLHLGNLPAADTADAILRYYQKTKGVGHTRSLFSGTGYVNGSPVRPTVITHAETMGRIISPGNNVTLARFKEWSIQARRPIIWDNSAIILLCQSFLADLGTLKDLVMDAEERTANLTIEGEVYGERNQQTSRPERPGRLLEGEKGLDNSEGSNPKQMA